MAVTAYDSRRPRIPRELASSIDEARGNVSFNAWVVRALEVAVGEARVVTPTPEPHALRRGSDSNSLRNFS